MPASGGKGGKGRLPANGFLRFCLLYIVVLLVLIVGLVVTGGGLLSRFGLSSGGSPITISSADQQQSDLPPRSGGSAPSGSVADVEVDAPSLTISGASVPSNQAGMITPYQSPEFYIVQPGDTPQQIADTYNTTASQIMSYNGLAGSGLIAGQVLYLPTENYQPVPDTGRNAGGGEQP